MRDESEKTVDSLNLGIISLPYELNPNTRVLCRRLINHTVRTLNTHADRQIDG